MPRAVVITKLDQARADFDESLAVCQRVFGEGVLPLYLPVHGEDEGGRRADRPALPAGLRLLLRRRGSPTAPEAEHVELIENRRNELIEAVIQESEDDSLMDRYLPGEEIGLDVLIPDLERAVARGSFYPGAGRRARCRASARQEILEILTQAFPSPLEHPLPAVTSPDGSPKAPLTLRPGRPARRRGRQDDVRPVRRPAQPGPGVLRDPASGHDRARLRAPGPLRQEHAPRSTATRTTTWTSASARCPARWARPSDR